MYKDLIFNSRGCRKSNQLLRHPYRYCMEVRTAKRLGSSNKKANRLTRRSIPSDANIASR